jgi:C1A family cysteine protease
MWRTDADGYIHATGENEGGHEVELIGVDVSERCVIGMNSWGDNWGVRGRFKLHWEDLETLLAEQGDAFVIIK